MAKTTMAQEVRVSRAQSVAQGQQVRPSVRSRDWSWPFWPAVPLYPYGRRRTLQEVVGHGLDLRPATGHFIHRRAASHDRREARSRGLLVYAPVSDSECIHLVKELVAEHGDVKYISCQQPLAWNTRSSSVPSPEAFERAGLCCSKPVELSAKPPAQLDFRETDSGAPRG